MTLNPCAPTGVHVLRSDEVLALPVRHSGHSAYEGASIADLTEAMGITAAEPLCGFLLEADLIGRRSAGYRRRSARSPFAALQEPDVVDALGRFY